MGVRRLRPLEEVLEVIYTRVSIRSLIAEGHTQIPAESVQYKPTSYTDKQETTHTDSYDSAFTVCPFHTDSGSEDLVISPFQLSGATSDKSLQDTNSDHYICKSCGVRGQIHDFVMRLHNSDYFDAVRYLCDQAGLDQSEVSVETSDSKRDIARILLEHTKRFYEAELHLEPKPRKAHRHLVLDSRLTPDSIVKWGLGSFPSVESLRQDKRLLLNYLELSMFNPEEIESLGLCHFTDQDTTTHRYDSLPPGIVLPIVDSNGEIVSFVSRDYDHASKKTYTELKESFIFKKDSVVYGLNQLRKDIERGTIENSGLAVLVDDYYDVMLGQQLGLPVVKSLTENLTRKQAKEIRGISDSDSSIDSIVIVSDRTREGIKHAQISSKEAYAAGLVPYVYFLPEGKTFRDLLEESSEKYLELYKESIMNWDDKDLKINYSGDFIELVRGESIFREEGIKLDPKQVFDLEKLLREQHDRPRKQAIKDSGSKKVIEEIIAKSFSLLEFSKANLVGMTHTDTEQKINALKEFAGLLGVGPNISWRMGVIGDAAQELGLTREEGIGAYIDVLEAERLVGARDNSRRDKLREAATRFIAYLLADPKRVEVYQTIPVDADFFSPELREIYTYVRNAHKTVGQRELPGKISPRSEHGSDPKLVPRDPETPLFYPEEAELHVKATFEYFAQQLDLNGGSTNSPVLGDLIAMFDRGFSTLDDSAAVTLVKEMEHRRRCQSLLDFRSAYRSTPEKLEESITIVRKAYGLSQNGESKIVRKARRKKK